jgi:hypothetical protein
MADTSRRLILRVTIKLLSLTALVFTGYILFSGDEGEARGPTTAPLLIELNTLHPAQAQRLEWADGPLQLLRMADNAPPFIFYDRGGSLNCPLSWQSHKSPLAPHQPWPGGFRDQCSGVWYRYDGQVLPGQGTDQNLQAPPYRLLNGHLLQIGVSGDNASPAN